MHEGKGDSFIIKFPTEYMIRIFKYAEFAKPGLLKKYSYEKDSKFKILIVLVIIIFRVAYIFIINNTFLQNV